LRQYQKFGLVPILLVSLVGCGKADQTAENGRTNEPLSVGYYSNENHENKGGNAILLDGADNDGPITEMMDHSLGAERNSNQRFSNVNNLSDNDLVNNSNPNPNPIETRYQDNLNSREPLMGGNRQNDDGHSNQSNHATHQNYYNGNMSKRVTQLVGKVENVKETKTVIQGNNVIVGVRLNDKSREGETIKNIQKAIEPQLNGRKFYLITNDHQFRQLRKIDKDLRNGGPNDELNLEINKLIQMNNNNR
jgi:spore cortex protein